MGSFRVGLLESSMVRPGLAGINLGPADLVACNLINIFHAATLQVSDAADAARLDEYGYLTSSPTAGVTLAFASTANGGSTWLGETYRMKWPSTVQFKIQFNTALTTVGTPTGCTVTGGTGVGATTIASVSGQAGQVDFTMGALQPSCFFTTGTYSHSAGELAFYRVSDEADYQAGKYWTPEYIARLRELRPAYIRPMGMVNAGGNGYCGEVRWANRMPLGALAWAFTRVIPSTVATITGTDAYTASSAGLGASWVDGEVFTGYITNQNTSTTVTMTVSGRAGTKDIIARNAAAIVNTGSGSSRMIAGYATFRYDSVLDKVIYSPGLYQVAPPYEALIQLANEVGTDLWHCLPYQCDDDYVTQLATLNRDTLNKRAWYEYSNEVWHNTWPQTGWCTARGEACGWAPGSNTRVYGWYGLRTAIMFKDLIPAVYGSLLSTKARRVHCYQGGGFLTIVNTRFNGTMLNTGIGNATYSTISGGRNFDTAPNRPVDLADSIAYAPYTGGTNFCRGDDILQTVGTENIAFFQALVDAWVAVDTATVYSMIDSDIRDLRCNVLSVTASGTTFTTASPHLLAVNDGVLFDATGGTGYSGVTLDRAYNITSVPTSTTFTVQAYVNGNNSGVANTNAGSAGTGTMRVGQIGRNIKFTLDWMPNFAEVTAASYDTDRSNNGLSPLRADWYEGNLEPKGPSQADLDAIAIPALSGYTNAQAATHISNALDGWRFSTAAKETMKTYYKAMTGRDPSYWTSTFTHSFATSQLVLPGPGLYSMTSGALPTSTPYQTYYGFKEFNEENPQ